jgi:hypothetical protein
MSEQELYRTLGPSIERVEENDGAVSLRYSRKVGRVRWYPMVSVRLVDGRVAGVGVKRYTLWGVDSEAVYFLKPGQRWLSEELGSTIER